MARGKNNVVEGIVPVRAVPTISTQTPEDKLIAYYMDKLPEAKLTKKVRELKDRWELAYRTYRTKGSINATLNVLTKFEWPTGTISRRTAQRDLANAQRFFSDGSDHNRKIMVDHELEEINKDIQLARINKDYKAVARLREIKMKYINDHMGDNAADLYKDLQMNVIVIGRFPEKLKTPLPPAEELLERLENLKKKKVTDVLDAEDAKYSVDAE